MAQMTPSKLTEGEFIHVTFAPHPDNEEDSKPTGAITVEREYGQIIATAHDKDTPPGSEGVPIPATEEQIDQMITRLAGEPNAIITPGRYW